MSGPFRADPEPSPHRPVNAYDLLAANGDAILGNTTYAHAIRLAEALNAWVIVHDAELRNQIAADIEQVVDTLWNRNATGFAGWEQIVAMVRGDQPGRADQ